MKQDRSIAQRTLSCSAPTAAMLVAGLLLVMPGTANAGGGTPSTGSVEINVSVAARVAVRTRPPPVGAVTGRPCLASNGAHPSLPVDMLWPEVESAGGARVGPTAAVEWERIGLCGVIAAEPAQPGDERRSAGAGWLLIRPQ